MPHRALEVMVRNVAFNLSAAGKPQNVLRRTVTRRGDIEGCPFEAQHHTAVDFCISPLGLP